MVVGQSVGMDVEGCDLAAKSEPPADSCKRVRPLSTSSPLDTVSEEPNPDTKSIMVDRGVGPTPVPMDSDRKMTAPPFLSPGPVDQAAYQQSLAYYATQSAIAGLSPLGLPPHPVGQPLNTHTNEGRYYFNPAFHYPNPTTRFQSSPSHSDVSLLSSPVAAGLVNPGPVVDRITAHLHWERYQRQLQQLHASPYNVSAAFTAAQRLANLGESSRKSMLSDIPVTPGSGSITLPPSLSSSRITSPRPSQVSGKGRKRALSHSPLSEFLDIQTLTRSSEGSLQLTPLLHHSNSRSSSAASGSYGHLSVGPLSSLTPSLKRSSPFRQPSAAGNATTTALYPGFQLPFPLTPFSSPPLVPAYPNPFSTVSTKARRTDPIKQEPSSTKYSTAVDTRRMVDPVQSASTGEGSAVVSSTVPGVDEEFTGNPDQTEEVPEFKETVCRWRDCSRSYDSHDDLVKHVNEEHVASDKKGFVCRWTSCCREEKPFKAQYMLVVHMRRHTGEKPHKCHGYPGCNKAYSRLENLKTHMRSHTGEKPYVCEVPGCLKAFSNASDRAKHQNRTHSSAKPYLCEIDGCIKRYTDPSSLRKHVKTVHGAEFYARKRHKGLDTPSCRSNNNATSGGNSKHDNPPDTQKVEDCLVVTGINTSERKHNQESMVVKDQRSPQSDADVELNVLANRAGESVPMTPSMGNPNLLITVVDEVEDESEHTAALQSGGGGGSGAAVQQLQRRSVNRQQMKPKIDPKASTLPSSAVTSLPSLPALPNLPGVLRKKGALRESNSSNQMTSLRSKRLQPEIKEPIRDLLLVPRRDSNTSTLSSYMSSLRSDASPAAFFNSRFSSRRSSEASQISNRLSIINSPYEYDMLGNGPEPQLRELNSVTDLLEKARLGSQSNLFVQSSRIERIKQPAVASDPIRREREGWRTATPAYTPLPHEYPQYERRRASDPIRVIDHNFTELKKLQNRVHSLNTVQPLPLPSSMKSLATRQPSHETFQSSQSSIATNHYAIPGYADRDIEASLEVKMIEDNEDVIIPDDMRQFLHQRKADQLPALDTVLETAPLTDRNNSSANNIEDWIQQQQANLIDHQSNYQPQLFAQTGNFASDYHTHVPLSPHLQQGPPRPLPPPHLPPPTYPQQPPIQNQLHQPSNHPAPSASYKNAVPLSSNLHHCGCPVNPTLIYQPVGGCGNAQPPVGMCPYHQQQVPAAFYSNQNHSCCQQQPQPHLQAPHVICSQHPQLQQMPMSGRDCLPYSHLPQAPSYSYSYSSSGSQPPNGQPLYQKQQQQIPPPPRQAATSQQPATLTQQQRTLPVSQQQPAALTTQQQRTGLKQQQQLSPPCEVTSSTDKVQQQASTSATRVPGITGAAVYDSNGLILDNMSSVSAELHSLTSQNISSVSRIRTPVESCSNMVVNNMSSILSQFAEENQYLNHDL